jgi:hypothetical protein
MDIHYLACVTRIKLGCHATAPGALSAERMPEPLQPIGGGGVVPGPVVARKGRVGVVQDSVHSHGLVRH